MRLESQLLLLIDSCNLLIAVEGAILGIRYFRSVADRQTGVILAAVTLLLAVTAIACGAMLRQLTTAGADDPLIGKLLEEANSSMPAELGRPQHPPGAVSGGSIEEMDKNAQIRVVDTNMESSSSATAFDHWLRQASNITEFVFGMTGQGPQRFVTVSALIAVLALLILGISGISATLPLGSSLIGIGTILAGQFIFLCGCFERLMMWRELKKFATRWADKLTRRPDAKFPRDWIPRVRYLAGVNRITISLSRSRRREIRSHHRRISRKFCLASGSPSAAAFSNHSRASPRSQGTPLPSW